MTNLCRGPDCACLEVTGVVAKLRYGGLCPVCVCPTSLICGEMVWPLGAAGSCVAGAPLVQARRAAADVGPGRRLTLQLVLCTSKGLKPGRGCPRFLGTCCVGLGWGVGGGVGGGCARLHGRRPSGDAVLCGVGLDRMGCLRSAYYLGQTARWGLNCTQFSVSIDLGPPK